MGALKTVLIILTFVLVVFVVIMLLGYFTDWEPFRSVYIFVMGYVDPAKEALTNVMSNPTAALGTVATAAGGLGGAATLYSKWAETKSQLSNAKTQVETEIANAKNQISSITAEKDKITEALTAEKTQLTEQFNTQITSLTDQAKAAKDEALQYKTQLSTIQTNFSDIQNQKANLQTTVEDLQKQVHDWQLKYAEAKALQQIVK